MLGLASLHDVNAEAHAKPSSGNASMVGYGIPNGPDSRINMAYEHFCSVKKICTFSCKVSNVVIINVLPAEEGNSIPQC